MFNNGNGFGSRFTYKIVFIRVPSNPFDKLNPYLFSKWFNVIQVDVRITQCMHEIASLQSSYVGNHVR